LAVKGFIKFIIKRAISIYIIVIIAAYLTVVIANMGGYLDTIIKGELYVSISMEIRNNPLYDGYSRDSGSRYVRNIILERLPQTVMLFTTATLINFVINIGIGLYLSRHYGGKLDKLFIALSPTSVIPGWFYGIFLIIIFASYLHVLPYGGILSVPAPTEPIPRFLDMLKHMVLPLSSWIISNFFLGCYQNRTFFLIFSTEDYVEAARAKGVPPRQIERNYILRPALPPIITMLALSLINSWGGAIITESVFNWKGLGLLTRSAISIFDSPVLIGITIIYAYLLALTVLILDILYGIIDPRIKAKFD